MGLFDSFKKQPKKEIVTFSEQIIKTEDVSMELKKIADRYNIALSNLDFDILNIDTYVKLEDHSEFVIADKQTLELLQNKEIWLHENFEIKQSYEIKIKKFTFKDDFELIGKLQANKTLTNANYILSPSSLLLYNDNLATDIHYELKKKKIKSGMIVDIEFLEQNFIEDISQLVAKIRILGMIEEDYSINLCSAITPIKPVQMRIIEHYKKNETTHDKIKDLIYPIKKDEIIIEILKPKEGKPGRNCRGQFLKIASIKATEIPHYQVKDDIDKKEDNDKILYIANKNGYIYLNENTISIKDELEVNQISLKTGNVRGGDDSDVKLEVSESSALKEAIKDGMKVETSELIVKGNVGNNAKIKAQKLEIDGQTHKKSKILAKFAQINSHKGHLKAKNAIINRLEGGIVEADNVHITQAISGKVIAKEIKIELLGSHIELISSERIEIDQLKGSENRFIISEAIVENKEEFIKNLEEKEKEFNIKIRQLKELYLKNKQTIKKNKPVISQLKAKVKELRENQINVNPNYIQKIKKYNDFIKKTKEIETKIENLKEKIKNIQKELNKIQEGVFLAKIISNNGFTEYNRIEFHLTEPPIKITYDTIEQDKYKKTFTLKDYGEMEYKIIGE